MNVSTATAIALAAEIPDECIAVAESGLRSGDDLRAMRDAGYDGFLIGERFVASPDPGPGAGRSACGGERRCGEGGVMAGDSRLPGAFDGATAPPPPTAHVKFCGITREEDAAAAGALGASAIGLVLWPGSPRGLDRGARTRRSRAPCPQECSEWASSSTPCRIRYGGRPPVIPLDVVQLHGEEPDRVARLLHAAGPEGGRWRRRRG